MGGHEGFDSTSSKEPSPWSPITPEKALASTTSMRSNGQGSFDELVPEGPGQEGAPLHHHPDVVARSGAGSDRRGRVTPDEYGAGPGRPGRDHAEVRT